MTKTKVSYKITAFADEREVAECEVDTIVKTWLKISELKHHYEHSDNFDSIRIITYVNNETVSEEWINM